MKIDPLTPDDAVLTELAARLARLRKGRRLSQVELADRAGVGVATLRRMEDGRDARLASWIRVLRALELTSSLEALLPPEVRSPLLEARGRPARPRPARGAGAFRWGDEER